MAAGGSRASLPTGFQLTAQVVAGPQAWWNACACARPAGRAPGRRAARKGPAVVWRALLDSGQPAAGSAPVARTRWPERERRSLTDRAACAPDFAARAANLPRGLVLALAYWLAAAPPRDSDSSAWSLCRPTERMWMCQRMDEKSRKRWSGRG